MGNSNSGSKEEIIVKCSLEEMVKHFFKDYAVIWHDPNVHSPENQQYIMQLRQFCDVLTFTEWGKALVSIQESKAACHVITSGTNGEVFVEKTHECNNISKIYVFCKNKEYHSTWAQKYQKISCVETNIQNVINRIKQNLLEWYREMSSLKVNLPAFAPIFNDVDKSDMNNLHRYLKIIPSFENRAKAKNDLLSLSKLIYTDQNNKKHIADFEKYYTSYCQTQILRWYTRESFLYKVTNNCLRIGTADSIQYSRLILRDLEQAIKEQYHTKSKDFTGLLYRGAYLSQEEWSSLKENQDKEIEMHGFLSVSKEKNVALTFMQTSSSQKVLITILVPKGPNEEEQGFAEIEEFSFFPQEREILFNVRSRFTVLETEDEYSPELPFRHLVLLYGAQGLRKYTAEQNPVFKVPVSEMVKINCCNCSQQTLPNFLFRPLDRLIYYCKNCIIENASNTTAFLAIPTSKNTLLPTETVIKGFFLTNNNNNNNQNQNQFNSSIPFYGYKCSQCQAKKQKSYFICTDCSQQNKLIWCEDCFTNTVSCIEAQHNILLETRSYTFWTQKMSKNELNHLKFHNNFISECSDDIFRQAAMYRGTHNYDKAIEFYSRYLQQTDDSDPYLPIAYSGIANVYRDQEKYEEALEYHFKSLEIYKAYYGPGEHPEFSICYGNIGTEYFLMKNYTKALEYNFKAIALFNSQQNEDCLATAYCNIGAIYAKQREYSLALQYYFQSVTISNSIHGENSSETAMMYKHIGSLFQKQKDYAKALEYQFKPLNIEKLLYGEKHPKIALSYQSIASVLKDEEEYDKALEYYQKALEIRKSLYGENHSDVARCYDGIGNVFLAQKEDTKALEYYTKSLGIKRLFYGENTDDIATSYSNMGKALNDQGEYNKAEEYHLKALNIFKTVLGENEPDTANSYFDLGKTYNNQGKYIKAEEYLLKAIHNQKFVFGEHSSEIANCYYVIADVYLNKKEHTKALECCLKSLEIRDSIFGKEHPNTIKAQNKLLEIKSKSSSPL